MGKRIKVLDLAQDMIELSGLRLGQDICIKYTGLNPGEKIIEELFSQDEHPHPTELEKILIINKSQAADFSRLHQDVDHLIALAKRGESEAAKGKLMSMVGSPL